MDADYIRLILGDKKPTPGKLGPFKDFIRGRTLMDELAHLIIFVFLLGALIFGGIGYWVGKAAHKKQTTKQAL